MTEEKKDAEQEVPAQETKESASAVGGKEEFNGGEEKAVDPTPPAQTEPTPPVETADNSASKEDDDWEEVTSDMGITARWTEEAKSVKEGEKTQFLGVEIVGLYVDKKENVGENSANIYQFKTVAHGMVGIWGSTVLDDKMKRIYTNNEVRIVFTGHQTPKSGGKAYMTFNVFQRPASAEFLAQIEAKEKANKGTAQEAPEQEKSDDDTMKDPDFE